MSAILESLQQPGEGEELKVRMLSIIFNSIRANESLAASATLFPRTACGMRDLDPRTAVNLYTGEIEKSLGMLITILENEEELVANEAAAGGGA